jgi:hypothetical protein
LKGLTTAPKESPKLHARKKRRRPAKRRRRAAAPARLPKKKRVSAVGSESTLEELPSQMTKTGREENARDVETAAAERI